MITSVAPAIDIRKPVGSEVKVESISLRYGGLNERYDVFLIQSMLYQALPGYFPMNQFQCDDSMVEAIREFQSLWGVAKPSGLIEPNDITYRRLVGLLTPLEITAADPKGKSIRNGGFKISYKGGERLPKKGYEVLLLIKKGMSGPSFSVDLTGRKASDAIRQDNLPDLLDRIGRLDVWGQSVWCYIEVQRNGAAVSTSNIGKEMLCPIRPHNGKLLPLDQAGNGSPALEYGPKELASYLYDRPVKITCNGAVQDVYPFAYGGRFVVPGGEQKRGLDCTTYAGSVWRVPSMKSGQATMDTSEHLASALESSSCSVSIKDASGKDQVYDLSSTDATAAQVEAFFDKPGKDGYYLLFKPGHIVVVKDGIVHEFNEGTESGSGYLSGKKVKDWLAFGRNKNKTWRVWKPKDQSPIGGK